MPERDDGHAALGVVQRAAAGAPVGDDELRHAVAHVSTCRSCASRFDVDGSATCAGLEDELSDAAETVTAGADLAGRHPTLALHLQTCERCRETLDDLVNRPEQPDDVGDALPLVPATLFPDALTGALSDPDPFVRARVAGRLGGLRGLGAAGLSALVDAAGHDDDPTVRAAALMALDRLDADVSFPQRVVDAWAEAPAEAAGYLDSVLSRLAHPAPPSEPRIAEFVATGSGAAPLTLRGTGGASGELSAEQRRLWLALTRLPSIFEHGRPIVAAPRALELPAPLEWSGARPGLVRPRTPVVNGALRVSLGTLPEGSPPAGRLGEALPLFDRFYLLDPETTLRG